jgi:hypothetical protein
MTSANAYLDGKAMGCQCAEPPRYGENKNQLTLTPIERRSELVGKPEHSIPGALSNVRWDVLQNWAH